MDKMYTHTYPYTLEDLSVVIPHWFRYPLKFEWFLKRYLETTPPEVQKNTFVVCDVGDDHTEKMLSDTLLQSFKVTESTWMNVKMNEGFKKVKTRLVARMHDDCYISNSNWTQAIVKHFNQNPQTQYLTQFHDSGSVGADYFYKMCEMYPYVKDYFDGEDDGKVNLPFMAGYIGASQTYVMRDLYNQVYEFQKLHMNGYHGNEDCYFTLFLMANRIPLTTWRNMGSFFAASGKSNQDFSPDVELPHHIDTDTEITL